MLHKMERKYALATLLLAVTSTVASSHGIPLASLPDIQEYEEPLPRRKVNLGMAGAVTQKDWDKATVHDAPPPTIEIDGFMGSNHTVTITGTTMKTIKNRLIYAFLGIRFGKEPSGDLRFKRTEPAGPYFGEETHLSAIKMGHKCPQMSMLGNATSGKEDCLFLNVYTPKLPNATSELLPVMMWIYGGAFVSGDASLYMPTRLLDKDIILVVIQYRLGSLGWFSLQNEDAPGNAGLWDMIEALYWIQDNIEGFGGDPNKVTVAGESAGSASSNYLLLLKDETEDLFRGVIGESGSALDHWSLDPDPIESAKLIGEKNGCETDDLKALYECMRDASPDQLTRVSDQFVTDDRKAGQMGFRGAAPVIQAGDYPGALVKMHPQMYFEKGLLNDVPLFIGANKQEGAFVFGVMYYEYLLPNNKLEDPVYLREGMVKDLLNTFGIHDPSNGIGEALMDDYLGGRDPADFAYASPGMVDLAGMLFLKAGAWETAKMHANKTTSKTFVYAFEFESDDTMFKIFFPAYKTAPFKHDGVCHADEMMYVYSLPASLDDKQLEVKDRLVALWTNFVIYGDPTPIDHNETWAPLNIPKWEPVETGNHHYMLIEGECTLMQEYPDRWHITLDDDIRMHTTTTPTESTATSTSAGPSQADYDRIKNEKQAYMISMIVFIITTFVAGVICAWCFFKHR